jgi:hypothetical protein
MIGRKPVARTLQMHRCVGTGSVKVTEARKILAFIGLSRDFAAASMAILQQPTAGRVVTRGKYGRRFLFVSGMAIRD